MDLFVAFKYLHIVSMFFAVALALSGEIILRRIALTEDVHAIRASVARIKPISGPLAGMLFMAGLVFGILAALAGQIDLLRPWLVLSYVAFAGAFLLGMTVTEPWLKRLEHAAAESPAEQASDTLRAIISDPRARFSVWALMGLVALLVFLMVVKPLG